MVRGQSLGLVTLIIKWSHVAYYMKGNFVSYKMVQKPCSKTFLVRSYGLQKYSLALQNFAEI